MRKALVLLVVLTLLVPQHAFACLWDYDTLAMERQEFPDAHELIAGHFVRHSEAYYQWRLDDRTAKPVEDWTPADFDDVAVAYDKLKQHDIAIATIQAKMDRWPEDGRYESEANLGTFLIHAGRLEEGLPHLEKAIEINPDAHFGREIYQQLLVEYVLERRADGADLPLDPTDARFNVGFAGFISKNREPTEQSKDDEFQAAAKGILGMMRFGQHDSPILLEALGDLMQANGERNGSKMLAARAYLKASYAVSDPAIKKAYREKAEQAMELQANRELPEIEADLKQEIQQADAFFQQIVADEKAWIATGKNVDQAFAEKYYDAPTLELNSPNWHPMEPMTRVAWLLAAVVAVVATLFGTVVFLVYRWVRPKRVANKA